MVAFLFVVIANGISDDGINVSGSDTAGKVGDGDCDNFSFSKFLLLLLLLKLLRRLE